jgi:hypothetical protein
MKGGRMILGVMSAIQVLPDWQSFTGQQEACLVIINYDMVSKCSKDTPNNSLIISCLLHITGVQAGYLDGAMLDFMVGSISFYYWPGKAIHLSSIYSGFPNGRRGVARNLLYIKLQLSFFSAPDGGTSTTSINIGPTNAPLALNSRFINHSWVFKKLKQLQGDR